MCERVIKSMSLPRNNGMRCIVDDADDAPNENLDEKKNEETSRKVNHNSNQRPCAILEVVSYQQIVPAAATAAAEWIAT